MTQGPLGIKADGVGKRHGRQWILRNIDLELNPGSVFAILGSNGSGKSSLLRIMCGFDRASEGQVTCQRDGSTIPPMDLPMAIAYGAPDQDLIPQLDVAEHIALHHRLRRPMPSLDAAATLALARLEDKGTTRVGDLSSGMRQRLALALAFSTDCSALFLDEPTSHLDEAGIAWYGELVRTHRAGRTLVVASNHNPAEYPDIQGTLELRMS